MPSFIDFIDLFIYGEWFINVPKKSSRYYNLIFFRACLCNRIWSCSPLLCNVSRKQDMGISELQHDRSKSVCLSVYRLSVDLSIFLSVCLPSSVDHLFLHSIHIGVHLSNLNKPVIKGHFYAGFTSISQCFNKKWDFLCKDVIHTGHGLSDIWQYY